MKQPEDKKTMELPDIPTTKKKKGRPITGTARTPAQRKSEQRARANEIIWGELDERRLGEIPESILIGLLAEKRHQANPIGRMIWEEIGRRNSYM